jgi:hypothetical protein
MRLGYSRPLEATDLYELQNHRASGVIAERITTSFEKRQKRAAEYNARLANGKISPGLKGVWWSIRGQRQEREKEWREKMGKKKTSLKLAVNDSVFWFWWSDGILRLISDVSLINSPLLVKVVLVPSPRPPNLTLSVRLSSVCRPQDWSGSSPNGEGCRLRARSLLSAGPGILHVEPFLPPRHGHRCLVTRSTDHRHLQQGSYTLHSCPPYSPKWKTGQPHLHRRLSHRLRLSVLSHGLGRSDLAVDHLFGHSVGQLGPECSGWFRHLRPCDTYTSQTHAFTAPFPPEDDDLHR